MMPWRSRVAIAADQLGKTSEAQRLAAEELALARRWGTGRAVGYALTAVGRVNRDTEVLAEAAGLLEQSADQNAFAEASFYLGIAYHRARQSGEARAELTTAHRLATDGGATRLIKQAKHLIDRIDSRRSARHGTKANILTVQEWQIAERAAIGASNREIADELFVTVRTVEHYLTAVYRKLGINGRRNLGKPSAERHPRGPAGGGRTHPRPP